MKSLVKRDWNSPLRMAFFSGLLTLMLSANFLSHGVDITTDGWGYWEGSISLLNGDGYVYFGGQPITVFGPFFSLYLAAVQKVTGVSGWSLVVGIVALAGLTSGAWSYLFCSLSNREATWSFGRLLFPVYVSMFVSFYFRHLLSEPLFLLLLALLFVVQVQIALQKKQNGAAVRQVLTLNLILMLLLFTRNSGWVFVPGVVVALWLGANHLSPRKRALLPVGTTLFAFLSWTTMRRYLGQGSSHSLTWGGNYTPREYFDQIIDSLTNIFGPQTYNAGWGVLCTMGGAMLWLSFIMVFHQREQGSKSRNKMGSGQTSGKTNPEQLMLVHLFTVTMSAFAGLYVIFNLTYIHDQLAGRFLWFLVLSVMGIWMAYTTWLPMGWSKRILSAILILVMLLQIMRTGVATVKWTAMTQSDVDWRVGLHHTIRPDYLMGEPIQDGNLTVVAPPNYEWLNRQYKGK